MRREKERRETGDVLPVSLLPSPFFFPLRHHGTYDRTAKAVTYRSDKSEGPTAGTETVDPPECLTRVLVHIPDKGHAPPHPGHHRGAGGRAEPAIDAGTVGTATTHCGPPRPLSTAPAPRRRAGTFGVRGGPAEASNQSHPLRDARRRTGPDRPRGASPRRRLHRGPPDLSSRDGEHATYFHDPDRNSYPPMAAAEHHPTPTSVCRRRSEACECAYL